LQILLSNKSRENNEDIWKFKSKNSLQAKVADRYFQGKYRNVSCLETIQEIGVIKTAVNGQKVLLFVQNLNLSSKLKEDFL